MLFSVKAPVVFAVLAAAFVLCDARPSPPNYLLHEKRSAVRSPSIKRSRVASDHVLPMKIGLKQGSLHKGYKELLEISDPSSPKYAQHWSGKDVNAAFAPHDNTVGTVHDWLVEAGIASDRISQSVNKGWLSFLATADEAEKLFQTEFYEHEDESSGKWSIGCDEYHLPRPVQSHVDYITPGVKEAQLRKRTLSKRNLSKRRPGSFGKGPIPAAPPLEAAVSTSKTSKSNVDLSMCEDQFLSPACIAAVYGIPELATNVQPGNAIGIFEEGEFFAQADLDAFFTNASLFTNSQANIPAGTAPTLNSVDGGLGAVNISQAGAEADLDLQIAFPIVFPQQITLFSSDDIFYANGTNPTRGAFNTFLDALDGSYCTFSAFGETGDDPAFDPIYPDPIKAGFQGQLMCGTYKPTNVISVSYSAGEADLPPSYFQRQCDEYMKLGLQGVSIFFSSGDEGVGGEPDSTNGTANGCLGNGKVFNPGFPPACPWITAVGATMLPNASLPEIAAMQPIPESKTMFTSGGGFSNIFPTPDYQQSVVQSYLKNVETPPSYEILGGFVASKISSGVFNRLGRGIPDLSAIGQGVATVVGGEFTSLSGTSVSAPLVASMFTRINDARLAAGKNTTGFINPTLYANPQMFTDITAGSNTGCGSTGFNTAPGWDPVTGLGSPQFERMLEVFTNLP